MKDLKIRITIGDNGQGESTTSIISGELKCFLIDTSAPIAKLDCLITEYPGITLLDLNNVMGNHYYPITTQSINCKGEGFNYSTKEFCLNNKLSFRAMGKRGSVIEVIVRYM